MLRDCVLCYSFKYFVVGLRMKIVKRLTDWMFNEEEWQEINAMTDDDLRWEFCRLLDESKQGRYQPQRFRRICYRIALRFEQQA